MTPESIKFLYFLLGVLFGLAMRSQRGNSLDSTSNH